MKHSCRTSVNHQAAVSTQQRAEGNRWKRRAHAFDVRAQVVGEDALRHDRQAAQLPERRAGCHAVPNRHARKHAVCGDVVVEIAVG